MDMLKCYCVSGDGVVLCLSDDDDDDVVMIGY